MASMEGVDWQGAGDTYVEHYLYHLLGDPTMQMWARPPFELDLRGILSRYVAGQVHVKIPINPGDPPPENTVLTLLNNGQAIGRALVGANGEAVISPEVQVEPENLQVSIVQDGALPAQDAVEDVPPKPQPQPEKVATTLSLDQPPATIASDTRRRSAVASTRPSAARTSGSSSRRSRTSAGPTTGPPSPARRSPTRTATTAST